MSKGSIELRTFFTASLSIAFLGACSGSTDAGTSGSVGGAPSSSSSSAATTGGQGALGGAASTQTSAASTSSAVNATGGTKATGGAAATGGVTPGTGGAGSSTVPLPTGGRSFIFGSRTTGGASSVETKATGGASSIATKATGGSSATSTGGSSSSSAGGAASSSGCGLSSYPPACSTKGSPCTTTIAGTERTYYVYLPTGYSASQTYPLVFQFHPMGGSAEQAISIPNIRSNFPAIYVTPQGLKGSDGNAGWPNTNGQDIEFTKDMLASVQSSYCVDNRRIFSTGFSYGGMMSFAIGCEMGDVFRAIAPMSGALYSDFNCKGTGHAVAMWGSHGLSDQVVPIDDGRAALAKILKENHCGTTTTAVTPDTCVKYEGCDDGYPVTWCEFDGPHQPPSFASSAIVAFFKTF